MRLPAAKYNGTEYVCELCGWSATGPYGVGAWLPTDRIECERCHELVEVPDPPPAGSFSSLVEAEERARTVRKEADEA